MDDDLKKELEEMWRLLDDRDGVLKKVMRRSNRELKRLSADNMLEEPSKYLANICVELDAKYDVGITLALDWMLNNYFEMEFDLRVRRFLPEIYTALKVGNYTEKNPDSHFRGLAFYVPHGEKTIFVHGGGAESWRYLVILDKLGYVHVRKIWNRLGRNCIGSVDRPTLAFYRKKNFAPWDAPSRASRFYGDCRDAGHVFTTKFLQGVDHVIWDIGTPMSWFMEVNSTWTELVNIKEGCGLSDPESVQKYYDTDSKGGSTGV